MCGIAGICSETTLDPTELERRLDAMAERIVHRGPDEQGAFIRPRVGLVSRRLKVIDLATGRMPISNETGTVTVVYNGEIYNYRELRDELARQGHSFRTSSDTEVLVHLYEEMGIGLVERLVGMFAFALWDEERAILYLVRDRLGIKPLYYRREGASLTFGSELKCVVAGSNRLPELGLDGLAEYLALGYIPAPRTIYRDHFKLPPASILQFQGGRVHIRRYWEFPRREQAAPEDEGELVDALEARVRSAVQDRLVSDVPLGSFLSGGVDSSTVVAFAAERTSGRLETFTVGFGGADELPYARRVSEHFDTDHHELVLSPDACALVDKIVGHFDEPFGDSSAIPTYAVSELARRHVTVALSGDGGDELFAGYSQYMHDARWAWIERIPLALRRVVFGGATRLLPYGSPGWNRLRALSVDRWERHSLYLTQELDHRWGGLLHPHHAAALKPAADLLREDFDRASSLPFAARLLYVDALNYLPDDILTKVDRTSMAHSLEARVPLLDHRVVEWAASLPIGWKLRNGSGKWALKELARRYLPASVIDRPKRGFSIPVADWLKRDLAGVLKLLLSPAAASRDYLYGPTVERLVGEHLADRRDHSGVLWRLLILELWLRRQGDGDSPPASELLAAARHG